MTYSATATALHLASLGNGSEAIAVLTGAADRSDVDALMQLAVWHLAGGVVPRDLVAGRALLARAVAIGHVDAGLMEIALTANGSGGPADWRRALALLDTAARGDPLAAAQRTLLRQMDLTDTGRPVSLPEPRLLSDRLDVRLYPKLFTADECRHLATVGAPLLEPARVIDPKTGRHIAHPVRTSDGCVIGPAQEDLVVQALNHRIAAASGTASEQGEPLAILRYAPGQHYRPHHDCVADTANQRTWTMLVYLNDGYAGGATDFPRVGVTVRGQRGDGLLFRNTDAAIRPDPLALHEGQPITGGQKWLATRWIRQAAYDPWTAAGLR